VVVAVLFGLNRLIFDIRTAAGFVCAPTAGKLREVQDGGVLNPLFRTDDPCRATGIELQPGQAYIVEFVVKERWIDKTIETSPAGFSSCSVGWLFSCVAPLRRSWTSDWFAPIIRVGALGLERYGLTARCVDPDPKCPRNTYVSRPFTVREQGEMFLYVNDTVLGLWPKWSGFYENNHGAAEVSIKPASSNQSG
jgi:hypothetical protein